MKRTIYTKLIDDDDDLIIIKKYCRKGTTYTGLLRCSNMVSFEQGTIHYDDYILSLITALLEHGMLR